MGAGYFLDSGALSGAENMDLDARLIDEVGRSGVPVLRLYSWSRPTLSLGYFQKLEDVADPAFVASQGVDLVRRPTGGGAILHANELTFSLILPAGHPALQGSVNDSYLNLTRPLLEFLRKTGMDAKFRGDCPADKAANCFAGAACPDIVVDGKKVFGSAQRRRAGAVLMHGSLLLRIDTELWQGVFAGQLGSGFAAVDLSGTDWGAVLKGAYGPLLGVDSWKAFDKKGFSLSGQA